MIAAVRDTIHASPAVDAMLRVLAKLGGAVLLACAMAGGAC